MPEATPQDERAFYNRASAGVPGNAPTAAGARIRA
jgi:hypothetical protein